MLEWVTYGTLIITAIFLIGVRSPKHSEKLRKLVSIYRVLFVSFSCALVIIFAQQKKDSWLPAVTEWFYETKQPKIVSATGLIKDRELEPIVPLINAYQLKESIHLNAPVLRQYPELPRGCEVTSLSMLLHYHDMNVDKMTLANQIKKDTTKYSVKNDRIYFGDPHQGFVGNMYNLSKPGYGVYHKPIASLAKKYVGDRVIDMTGGSFFEMLVHLNAERPVWVITNTTYKKLPTSAFQEWHTPNGKRFITMKEHSVLVTGYDKKYIYFNDPLGRNKKAPINDFREAWVQMGKQAITIK